MDKIIDVESKQNIVCISLLHKPYQFPKSNTKAFTRTRVNHKTLSNSIVMAV